MLLMVISLALMFLDVSSVMTLPSVRVAAAKRSLPSEQGETTVGGEAEVMILLSEGDETPMVAEASDMSLPPERGETPVGAEAPVMILPPERAEAPVMILPPMLSSSSRVIFVAQKLYLHTEEESTTILLCSDFCKELSQGLSCTTSLYLYYIQVITMTNARYLTWLVE
jgi:hypothetical protein